MLLLLLLLLAVAAAAAAVHGCALVFFASASSRGQRALKIGPDPYHDVCFWRPWLTALCTSHFSLFLGHVCCGSKDRPADEETAKETADRDVTCVHSHVPSLALLEAGLGV